MEPLVSVVVPVYNVEQYVERCLRSIMKQTYSNLEIIVVNDGSTDNSGMICEQLAKEDARIKVYNKENGGLSDARNYGTAHAVGKYIGYIDSDDYVAHRYFEYLVELCQKHNAEIACCCLNWTEEETLDFSEEYKKSNIVVMSGRKACKKMLTSSFYLRLVVACGKLYTKEIAQEFHFPQGHIHEDEATTAKFLYKSQKVVISDQKLYAYFQNPKSIMHMGTDWDKRSQAIRWAMTERARFFELENDYELSMHAWGRVVLHMIAYSTFKGLDYRNDIKRLSKEHKLHWKMRIRVFVFLISPILYKKMFEK